MCKHTDNLWEFNLSFYVNFFTNDVLLFLVSISTDQEPYTGPCIKPVWRLSTQGYLTTWFPCKDCESDFIRASCYFVCMKKIIQKQASNQKTFGRDIMNNFYLQTLPSDLFKSLVKLQTLWVMSHLDFFSKFWGPSQISPFFQPNHFVFCSLYMLACFTCCWPM